MKYGCGDQKDRLASCTSFMLGLESMPYCWAAKSMAKEREAAQRAVEWEIPILNFVIDLDFRILLVSKFVVVVYLYVLLLMARLKSARVMMSEEYGMH